MKTLMKKVGGCKKARFWNMAKFQTRRWHREQAARAAAPPEPPSASGSNSAFIHASTNPPIQPSAPPSSSHPPILPSSDRALIQQSTNPEIQPQAHPPIQPSAPPAENPKWDKNQNFKVSQSSPSATSADKVGTPVPPPSISSSSSSSSSCSNSPLLSAKQPKIKNAFLHLRANGWSLRSISAKLGVPKSTLFNWESDRETRRTIDVLKSLQVEKLQERYIPSFEEELQKLSTCLSRVERALEKQDFEKMRPEFLLRTFLQLRARLNNLRTDTQPTDTLNYGPQPETVRGCISRSEQLTDSDDDSSSSSNPSPSPAPSVSSEKSVVNDLGRAENPKWDKNQNSEMSQPSTSATSNGGIGTLVPPGSAPVPREHDQIVLTAGFRTPCVVRKPA